MSSSRAVTSPGGAHDAHDVEGRAPGPRVQPVPRSCAASACSTGRRRSGASRPPTRPAGGRSARSGRPRGGRSGRGLGRPRAAPAGRSSGTRGSVGHEQRDEVEAVGSSGGEHGKPAERRPPPPRRRPARRWRGRAARPRTTRARRRPDLREVAVERGAGARAPAVAASTVPTTIATSRASRANDRHRVRRSARRRYPVTVMGWRGELADRRGGGLSRAVDRARVDHLAVLHAGDPLGGGGDVVVVGDHEDRLAALVEAAEQLDHLVPALGVEGARRLVGEQQGRLVGEGPGDGEPLALAAGERARGGLGLVRQAEQVEQVAAAGLGRLALRARRSSPAARRSRARSCPRAG